MVKLVKKTESASSIVKRSLGTDHKRFIRQWAILSAENPMGLSTDNMINKYRNKSLEEDFNRYMLKYIPLEGKFGNDEHSFLVVNPRLKDISFLASKYEQKSFIFGKYNYKQDILDIYYYEVEDIPKALKECKDRFDNNKYNKDYINYRLRFDKWTYVEKDHTNIVKYMADAPDLYSRFKNYKFNIPFSIFQSTENKLVSSISNQKQLLENLELSLDEDLTIHAATEARQRLFSTVVQVENRKHWVTADEMAIQCDAELEEFFISHPEARFGKR